MGFFGGFFKGFLRVLLKGLISGFKVGFHTTFKVGFMHVFSSMIPDLQIKERKDTKAKYENNFYHSFILI